MPKARKIAADNTPDTGPAATRFKPGQSGNPAGRQKGTRNKLGEAFVEALQADFEEHGITAITIVRTERPQDYLKVIASILPREIKVTSDIDGLTDEQLDQRIQQIAAALGLSIEPLMH